MENIILLSSDEEDFSPPSKKQKISDHIAIKEDCIVLSDEEDSTFKSDVISLNEETSLKILPARLKGNSTCSKEKKKVYTDGVSNSVKTVKKDSKLIIETTIIDDEDEDVLLCDINSDPVQTDSASVFGLVKREAQADKELIKTKELLIASNKSEEELIVNDKEESVLKGCDKNGKINEINSSNVLSLPESKVEIFLKNSASESKDDSENLNGTKIEPLKNVEKRKDSVQPKEEDSKVKASEMIEKTKKWIQPKRATNSIAEKPEDLVKAGKEQDSKENISEIIENTEDLEKPQEEQDSEVISLISPTVTEKLKDLVKSGKEEDSKLKSQETSEKPEDSVNDGKGQDSKLKSQKNSEDSKDLLKNGIDQDSKLKSPKNSEKPKNFEEITNEEPSTSSFNNSQEASSSTANEPSDLQKALSDFIDICATRVTKEAHKKLILDKTNAVKKLLLKIEKGDSDLTQIKQSLSNNTRNIETEPSRGLVFFHQVYQDLKCIYDSRHASPLDPKKVKYVKRLEKTLTQLRRKIRNLEEREVNWDDDDDSTYIQMQRYREKAADVFKALCKYRNEDPHYGRLLYSRLDFARSKYWQINQEINRKYKNNSEFPTYFDMNKLIKKCVKNHKLNISQSELEAEVKLCFKELGKLLQRRRQRDLLQIHNDFIEDMTDPAKESHELDSKLKISSKEAESRIDEICEKYVRLQQEAASANTTDSSNSQPSSSDDDEEMR